MKKKKKVSSLKGRKQSLEHCIKKGLAIRKAKEGKVYVAWNKGLTKETDVRIAKGAENMRKTQMQQCICENENCKKEFILPAWRAKKTRFCSRGCRFTKDVREKMRKAHLGTNPFTGKSLEQKKQIIEKGKETRRLNAKGVRGGKAKYYETQIGQVQGTYELNYIQTLILEKKKLPKKPEGVKTPLGNYYPDFEFPDRYIEIKCEFTYKVYLGKEKTLDKKFSTVQKEKLEWVAKNIKPVEILVYNNKYHLVKSDIIAKAI